MKTVELNILSAAGLADALSAILAEGADISDEVRHWHANLVIGFTDLKNALKNQHGVEA